MVKHLSKKDSEDFFQLSFPAILLMNMNILV